MDNEKVPEWAMERAIKVLGLGWTVDAVRNASPHSSIVPHVVFRAARYVAEHEEQPVDPLLIEAREIAGEIAAASHTFLEARCEEQIVAEFASGECDHYYGVARLHALLTPANPTRED